MNGNMLRHKIMKFALDKYIANKENLYFTASELPGYDSKKKKKYISEIGYLGALGYLDLYDKDTRQIRITSGGFTVAIGNYYLKEERKIWLNFTRDGLLIGCNIAVAIAAIKALNNEATNEKTELNALRLQVDSIRTQLQQKGKAIDTVYYLRLDTTFPHP